VSSTDTCKRTAEITVPLAEVLAHTEKLVLEYQRKATMPGFRAGKVPLSVIRKRFHQDIRQQVVEHLVPIAFRREADAAGWRIVGDPKVTDIHFHEGSPLKFKADYEVAPEFELGEYRDIEAPFKEPEVTEADIDAHVEQMRVQRAEYVNIDPRSVESGDYVAISLNSIAGVEGEPVQQDEMVLHVGGEETMPVFSEALLGRSPGDEMDVEVEYPEDYSQQRLAGRQVTFHLVVKGLRRREIPELNDEFAKDVGDFQNLGELRDETRRNLLRAREQEAQAAAKTAIVDKLVDTHEFPVPQAWVDAQIESVLQLQLQSLGTDGPVDLSKLNLDWDKLREAVGPRATREVRGSLILSRIADRESIEVLNDEVDRELHRMARNARQPAARLRMQMEKDGALGRIANQIRTNKVLNFLFENARKVAPPE